MAPRRVEATRARERRRGEHRRILRARRAALSAVCAMVLSACSFLDGGSPLPGAGEAGSPTASPTLPAFAEVPDAEPLRLRIARTDLVSGDGSDLLGAAAERPDEAAVREAVERARASLEGYLNAQFVDPSTRFTPEPVEQLLTEAALARLDRADRRGFGAIFLPHRGVVTGPASAVATVAATRADVHAVTLRYEARLTTLLPTGARTPLVQRGLLVFPASHGRAQAASVTLESRDPLPPGFPPGAPWQLSAEAGG